MAMKKADLEYASERYRAIMEHAHEAQRRGLLRQAVELAISSWEYIDGMMQYERKYADRQFASLEGIDLVLRFAPLLFDFQSLDVLDALLQEKRRIERDTSEDLGQRLADARSMMWDVRRLWDHLEQHHDARQDQLRRNLGGDQDLWRFVAETWEKMGLLNRTPDGGSYRLSFSTRLGEVVAAKCPGCAAVSHAPKSMLLEENRCPDCARRACFVLLPATADQTSET